MLRRLLVCLLENRLSSPPAILRPSLAKLIPLREPLGCEHRGRFGSSFWDLGRSVPGYFVGYDSLGSVVALMCRISAIYSE